MSDLENQPNPESPQQGGRASGASNDPSGGSGLPEIEDVTARISDHGSGGDMFHGDDMTMGTSDEEDVGGLDDEDDEMIVLDPEHPLMYRFQLALGKLLSKQSEKATLELRELEEGVRNKRKEREELGVSLYGLQQELAKQQMILEKLHDEYNKSHAERLETEENCERIRNEYRMTQENLALQRKAANDLQQDLDNCNDRLFYINKEKQDVRGDISVMMRAAEKAEKDVSMLEEAKQKQDLYVDRLVDTLDKLKEQLALYETQLVAQGEETKAAKDALMDAQMEIESINLEKKQIYQQWNSSITGMHRRDEAHSALVEALDQQKQKTLTMQQEVEAYKKSIAKSQEENERLTLLANQHENEINTVKKQVNVSQSKKELLTQEYATYKRTLDETEQALARVNTDKVVRENEVKALQKNIEKEYQERVRLEEAIEEKIRSQLTMDKAAKYTKRVTDKLKTKTHSLENQISNIENEIARETLNLTNTMSRVKHLEKASHDLDVEIQAKNEVAAKSQSEILKRNAMIERKQGQIDLLNKKIDALKAERGGEEISPQEFEIKSLQKAIQHKNQELTEMQQYWLREQTELVRMSQERDEQANDVDILSKQLTVLEQRKMRVENDIAQEEKQISQFERSVEGLQKDMIRMNTLLVKNKDLHHNMQQENVLAETDFVAALKEAETKSMEMQAKVDSLQEEKERLLNSLVEAERQIMLWEKKTQILRETREAVDSEAGQGEIKEMKNEIHRMEVRLAQLLRQQENMIQDMEKAVSRRDTIVTRGEAQQKMKKPVLTQGILHKQLSEMRKKIKKCQQESQKADEEIERLKQEQISITASLDERKRGLEGMNERAFLLDEEYEKLLEQRQRNLADILAMQQKAKHFESLKAGKYVMLCKTEAGLEAEHSKQLDRFHKLTSIVDRLNQEVPQLQPALRKVTLSLGSRGGGADGLDVPSEGSIKDE